MLTTVDDFVKTCRRLDDISDAYYVFEDECSDSLRDSILALADEASSEPFREAMFNLGFVDY